MVGASLWGCWSVQSDWLGTNGIVCVVILAPCLVFCVNKSKHVIGALSVGKPTQLSQSRVLQLIFHHVCVTKLGRKPWRRRTLLHLHWSPRLPSRDTQLSLNCFRKLSRGWRGQG